MALWFFEYALGQAEDIAIRMRQNTDEYLDNITPPFTKALFTFVKERKYTFCTPGHMGGTAYQKSPVGCLFYDFFGGNTLKADVSISVTELGSLLDHTGPHLEAEEYIARTFGAEQSYIVTNGTSTSNKIVGMYAAPSGSTLLIDRNCHKSLAHLLMMNDVVPVWLKPTVVPVWLKPTRNALGILGGIPRREFTRDSIEEKVAATTQAQWPVHAVITNSTYDGLLYNTDWIKQTLDVPSIHFDSAWVPYTHFHPIYQGKSGMRGILGGIPRREFTRDSIEEKVAATTQAQWPVHAVITNSTYDGLLYNTAWIKQTLDVPSIHFDSAWVPYTHFHPIYQGKSGMSGERVAGKVIFETQSTHKMLAALSQASLIHIKGEYDEEAFNEAASMTKRRLTKPL